MKYDYLNLKSYRPKFEMLSDPEDDERADVYTRLSDAKAYQQGGQAVDVWAQKTGDFHHLCDASLYVH